MGLRAVAPIIDDTGLVSANHHMNKVGATETETITTAKLDRFLARNRPVKISCRHRSWPIAYLSHGGT
jgi:hypothetical protein